VRAVGLGDRHADMVGSAPGLWFYRPDAGGPDIFLHVSDLEDTGVRPMVLKIGQRVSYDTTEHAGKPKAVDIRLV
jgi:cold shock CspA family protein